jgi:hypothetical protein
MAMANPRGFGDVAHGNISIATVLNLRVLRSLYIGKRFRRWAVNIRSRAPGLVQPGNMFSFPKDFSLPSLFDSGSSLSPVRRCLW